MYECLKNVIGVRELCDKNLDQGYLRYLDDLEGMTPSAISNFVNLETNETSKELVDSKIELAIRGAYYDFISKLKESKSIEIKTILCCVKAGIFQKNKCFTPSKQPRGVRIESKYSNSEMVKIKVNKISFYSDKSADGVDIIIKDGVEEHSFNTNIKGNRINDIYPNFISNMGEIFIYVKDDRVIPNESKISDDKKRKRTTCYDCGCCHKDSKCMRVYGWGGNEDDEYTYGFQVEVCAYCSDENFICAVRDQMADIFLYYTAMEVIKEGIFASRINQDTINTGSNEKLLQIYQKNYDSKLKAIVNSVADFARSYDKNCFECKGNRVMQSQMGGYDVGDRFLSNLRWRRRSF